MKKRLLFSCWGVLLLICNTSLAQTFISSNWPRSENRQQGNTISHKPFAGTAQRMDHSVTGKVSDDKGDGLPGVSIVIKGTQRGTISDTDGKYALSVPDQGATLVFSFVGYLPQEKAVGSMSTIDIMLKTDSQALDEVVVVGYGTQKRKDITGAVGSVDSKEIKDLSITRVEQALSSRVAGVQVKSVSGEPGAAPQIRIRGIGSISAGADPLYVVDGFPIDNIQALSPNDIESIDVLKDASATAIYGSRGANGVVIINTKRGKAGKPALSFDTYIGWQKILKRPEFLNVMDQANYYYDGVKNQNIDAGKDVSGPANAWFYQVPTTIMDVLEGRNTNNTDALGEVLRVAPQQSYQISASGGNDNVKYAVSAGYLNQDGIIINTNFKRYSLKANIDAQLTSKLSMKLNLNTGYSTTNYIQAEGGRGGGEGIVGNATYWLPYYPLYNQDGSYFVGNGVDAANIMWNPMAIAKEIKSQSETLRTLMNLSTAYQFTDALKLNVMIGASTYNLHSFKFIPNIPAFYTIADGTDTRNDYLNWITETTLNYNKSFGKHSFTGLIGYTTQKQTDRGNSLRSRSFPNNLVYTLNAASNLISAGTSTVSQWSLISYLARFNYNYDSKYYVTASVRADGSSRFGMDNKYGYFPSAAFAWRISQEKFLKDVSFISDMKIRTSYGETGNNNIGNYAHYATIAYESYPFGGAALGGYAPSVLANPSLTWEKQRSFNTGIDLSILNNRVAFNVDYFQTKNYKLLLNVNVPLLTGFGTALQNIGQVQNNGWEFVVSSKNLVGKFQWSTDFNVSTFRNKVVKLGPEGAPIIGNYHITQVGQPIGMFYGYLTDGVFLSQAELDAGPIYNPGASDRSRVGDIRFKDIGGPDGKPDGVINSYDRAIMGSPYPDFYYGMTNRFEYQNISLSFNLQGSQGSQTFSDGDQHLYTRARYRQQSTQSNYWKSETDPGDGKTVRPNNDPKGGIRQKSDRYINNASFLRVNNISLAYQVPTKISEKIRLSSLRIYMTATNPILITKNRMFNPEVSNSGSSLTPGIDNDNYPVPKSLIVGLNVSF
jgi:TonB-linked SusC/RagA family outer membrane protein